MRVWSRDCLAVKRVSKARSEQKLRGIYETNSLRSIEHSSFFLCSATFSFTWSCSIAGLDRKESFQHLADMGNGASAAAGLAAAAGKMDEKELKDVVAALDKDTADKLRKALGAGEESKQALPAHMKCAIWLWDAALTKEELGKCDLEGGIPDITGKDILSGSATFEKTSDQEKVDSMVKKTCLQFFQDQCAAEKPYEPPADLKRRCVYTWDIAAVEEFLNEIAIKSAAMDGKRMLTDGQVNFTSSEQEKVKDVLGKVGRMFMQDIAASQ